MTNNNNSPQTFWLALLFIIIFGWLYYLRLLIRSATCHNSDHSWRNDPVSVVLMWWNIRTVPRSYNCINGNFSIKKSVCIQVSKFPAKSGSLGLSRLQKGGSVYQQWVCSCGRMRRVTTGFNCPALVINPATTVWIVEWFIGFQDNILILCLNASQNTNNCCWREKCTHWSTQESN